VVGLTDAYKPYPERRGLYRPSSFQAASTAMAAGASAPRLAATAGR
jgi:chemotaxis protein methyltransferase CheR